MRSYLFGVIFFPLFLFSSGIRGIIVSDSIDESKSVEGVHFSGIEPPSGLKEHLEQYLDLPIDSITLDLIRKDILNLMNSEGDHICDVIIPKQKRKNNDVLISVVNAKVGNVSFNDTRYFNSKRIEKTFDLNAGDPIHRRDLLNNSSWLNRNPFRRTEVILSPGTNSGTSDIEIVTKARGSALMFGTIQ